MRAATIAIATLATSAALGLVACESTPGTSIDFTPTRIAVQDAAAQPEVIRYASAEVARAREYLAQAESRGADRGAGDNLAAHYAYLATQFTRIATQRAHELAARARLRAGELERERFLHEARLADARREHAAELLARFVSGTGAARTERGLVITLDDKLFDQGRARLRAEDGRSLERIAQFLKEHPDRRVQVEAFTDSVGAPSFNLELSQSRADAIAMAFINRGIDAARVRALGYGEWFAAPENSATHTGTMDRRVEVVVSHDAGVIPALLPIVAGMP